MRVRVPNVERVVGKMNKWAVEKQVKTKKALMRAANVVANAIKDKILEGPKTGAMYGSHQASAPGESPATDTGKLIGSVRAEPDGEGAAVFVRAPYAYALEFGTEDGKIAERPFVAPAVAASREKVRQVLREAEE